MKKGLVWVKQNYLLGWQSASTYLSVWVAANKKEEEGGHCAQL